MNVNKVDMKLNRLYGLCLVLTLFTAVFTTHFRGGYITWKPDPFAHDKIIVTWRLSWRNSYNTATMCNEATILSNGTLLNSGSINCKPNCTPSDVSSSVICTDFSPSAVKDWSSGENSASIQINQNATLQYTGGDWIDLINGGGGWALIAHVDLKRRSDNYRINASPTTIEPPIVYTQRGCPITIKVPVFDADGDIVRCRWDKQAGGIARPPPGILTTLDEANCSLTLVHDEEDYIAIALSVEDFLRPYTSSSQPLSRIPLQFLVRITSSSLPLPCDQRPQFVSPTPEDGTDINVEPWSNLNLELRARGSTSSLPITAFTTISPRGLIKSDIKDGGYNEKYISLHWTPAHVQLGSVELFCFSADDNVQSSEQRCVTFTIGEDKEPPVIIGIPFSLQLDTDPNLATANVSWTLPTVHDNSPQVTLTSNHKPGDVFGIGNTTVIYKAVDGSGNTATASFSIIVTDNQAPRITAGCPALMEDFTDMLTALVHWRTPNFTDNSGQVEWSSDFNSPSQFAVGSHQVVYVARDSSGNTANCTISINVTAVCYSSSAVLISRNFTWPLTVANNQDVDALETCGNMTKNNGQGEAVRVCEVDKSRGTRWLNAKYIGCGENGDYKLPLSDLSETTVVNHTVVSVAQAVVNATRDIQNTTSDDIQDIATTLGNIVDVESDDPQVTVSVVNIVNNVISAAEDINNNADDKGNLHESELGNSKAFLDILVDFEDQITRATQSRRVIPPVVEENIIFTTTAISSEATDDLTFQIIGGSSEPAEDSFSDVDLRMGGNDAVPKEAVRASVSLPAVIFKETNTSLGVSLVVHRTDVLFPSNVTRKSDDDIIVGSDIIAVLVAGAEHITNLSAPVVLEFTVQPGKPSCVFWDFFIQDWFQEGCQVAEHTKSKLTCHCNHLTNFAVLVDANFGSGHIILDVISKVGCVVSMIALLLTIGIFLTFRRLRRGSGPKTTARKILIQFCIALCLLYFMFLVGIDQTRRPGGCVFIAIMLQYLTLCSLMWMGIEAQNLYVNIVRVFDPKSDHFLLRASMAAWGIPIVITVISLSAGFSSYKHMKYCFVASYPLYFGVILPVAIILLHNLVIFGMVIRVLLKAKVGGSMAQAKSFSTSERLKNAISITVLIGLTWVFGFFAIEDAEFIISLIFCVCNSFQGIVIFVLFCARQADVQSVLRPYYHRIRGIQRGKSRRLSETGSTGLPSGSESVTRQPSHSTDETFKHSCEPVESFSFEPSYEQSKVSRDKSHDHNTENNDEMEGTVRSVDNCNDSMEVVVNDAKKLIGEKNDQEVNTQFKQNPNGNNMSDDCGKSTENDFEAPLQDLKDRLQIETDANNNSHDDQTKQNTNKLENYEENEDQVDATKVAKCENAKKEDTVSMLPSSVADEDADEFNKNRDHPDDHSGGKSQPKKHKRRIYSVYEVIVDDKNDGEEQRSVEANDSQRSDKTEYVLKAEQDSIDGSREGTVHDDSDDDMLEAPIVIENAIKDARVEIDND